MTFQIERVRTAILVRNQQGIYRIVYFAQMPRERVLELMHEYGLDDGEVLAIESFGMRETLTFSDEQLATLLQAAFAVRPFATDGGALRRETVVAWVESLLQAMLSRGRRLCPLTDYQKKKLYTLVCTILQAL